MRTKTTRLHGTEAAAAAVGAVRQPLPAAVAFLGEASLAEAGLPPDQEKSKTRFYKYHPQPKYSWALSEREGKRENSKLF